jgi:hypothetical protein
MSPEQWSARIPAVRRNDGHDGLVDRGGAELSRLYYEHLVGPALDARWPGLPRAAGRWGSGSDVLGLDDAVSRDHDWGLRLNLLVSADIAAHVDAYLEETLPESFEGLHTRFPTTWDAERRHRVQVEDVASFVHSRTGVDLRDPLAIDDWLMLTGQAVLEVTAGPVFVDTDGALTAARADLRWYPDDVWTYVVAADWARLAQELPLVGRTAERGDDLGSRIITARLAEVATHLAHLIDRRWPPYSKWLGTSLTRLPRAHVVAEPLARTLTRADWRAREDGLVEAVRTLNRLQAAAGLPTVDDPVEQFWDRDYRGIRLEVVEALEESIDDPVVRALPRGVGSAEQRSHNVDVLMNPSRRRPPSSRV